MSHSGGAGKRVLVDIVTKRFPFVKLRPLRSHATLFFGLLVRLTLAISFPFSWILIFQFTVSYFCGFIG